MKANFWAKTGIILGSLIVGIYVLFLLLPFCLNFFINKYIPQITGEINKATGLSAGIEDIKIVTTPKLTAGVKIKKFELYTPKKEPILNADNFQVKMSLLPILAKNIRVDIVSLNNADITLKFNKEGDLDLLQYLPESDKETEETQTSITSLPLGLKLSNHLPDIRIGGYKVTVTDGKDNYVISGGKTDVTDFIINKSVKIKGSGKVTLKDREQFNYNIKLFNKIMPDTTLDELVFNPQPQEQKKEAQKVDVISIFKGLYDYKVTANADVDLETAKDSINGKANIKNVSLIELPASSADLVFKGDTINIDSKIYTAKNEVTTLKGKYKNTDKNSDIDMNLKSDLTLSNTLNLVKKIALIFNIKDLQTLTASGGLNADLNIKSDLKTVKASGYLKVPSARVYYGAYKIGVDNINADIQAVNNNINIKNVGFTILDQPLKVYGTLSSDAVADIHAVANSLSVKGLLVALGQASIMKENPIYSGTLSMDAIIKGKLDKINPKVKLSISNLDLKNTPSDIRLKAPITSVNITSDGKTFSGNATSTNVRLINPALTVSAPSIKANITPDTITVLPAAVSIEKIKTTVHGKITDYLTNKIGLNFVTSGDIKSTLNGNMNVKKQTLNLVYQTTDLSTIIIPMFDRSKLSFKGKINITGNMTNPIISGSATVPSVSIPEVPVTMNGMDVNLNGTILHGSATVKNFASGGIKAQNISSDFVLKGMDFYLNNMKGEAFKGKFSGDLVYNLTNAKTKLSFKGSGMDAEAVIEGGAGIKNALSGTLGFNTKLTLTVLEYNKMIKSMKGDLNFDIKNGAFGKIGRFEGFLGAGNITQNYFLKNTVNSLSNAAGLATTAEFDTLSGKLTFLNGWAKLNPVKSAGQSLCYYITGKYNLLNGTTNVIILGKLDAPMVSKLGVFGTLNMSNIIGNKAASILKTLTTSPQGEDTTKIPALTNKSTNYQEFKVTFNGGVESKSSIKSFKWLKNADLTNYQQQTVKDVVKNVKEAYKTDINAQKEEFNNNIAAQKKKIEDTKTQIKTTQEDFKNIWKSIKSSTKPAATNTTQPATTPTDTAAQSQPAATGAETTPATPAE